MHNQPSKLFKSGLLSLLIALLIMTTFAQGVSAAPSQSAPAQVVAAPITHILQIQPIITATDDGSEVAFAFGGGPGDASYEFIVGIIKQVWAQAGIHVIVLPAKQWNNTLAFLGDACQYTGNTGDGSPGNPCTRVGNRPHDDVEVIEAAAAAGIASTGRHDTVIDMYFLRNSLDLPIGEGTAGVGRLLNNSLIVGISDAGWFADQEGQTVIGEVLAHEIGHNLLLDHTEDDPAFAGNPCPPYNIMLGAGCGPEVPRGIELFPSQIAIALTGPGLTPVPALGIANTQINSLRVVVKNMSIRRDVKASLLLPLEAARLALKNNRPANACKAMKVFDASVTYFLSKGKLNDSQGRLLNTGSKDIRAPIGCR